MGEAYSLKLVNDVTSVAAAKFVTAGPFNPTMGASRFYERWDMGANGNIMHIRPPVEAGTYTEAIVSVISHDPSSNGIKASGEYSNVTVTSDTADGPVANDAVIFSPGSFSINSDTQQREYATGADGRMETPLGTGLSLLYAGNWLTIAGTNSGPIGFVYEHDVFGYDKGVGNVTADKHFVRNISGVFGSVNGGAIYTATNKQFSFNSLISRVGTGATYMIPDKPENRMRYRPGRNLVDAAMYAEQKMLLAPTRERLDMDGGVLGLPYYGPKTPFRFHTLVEAGMANQYILEKATSKTRMTDASQRNRLVFTKLSLMDPNSERILLPDNVRVMDSEKTGRAGKLFTSPVASEGVLTRESIRAIQRGRQLQRQSKS
jgi:hypothetical protein